MINVEMENEEIKVLFREVIESVQVLDFQSTLRVVEVYQEFLKSFIELQNDMKRIQNCVDSMSNDNDFEALGLEYQETYRNMQRSIKSIKDDLTNLKKAY